MIQSHTILFSNGSISIWQIFNCGSPIHSQWICFNPTNIYSTMDLSQSGKYSIVDLLSTHNGSVSIRNPGYLFQPNTHIHKIQSWFYFKPILGVFQPDTNINIIQYWVCFNHYNYNTGSVSTTKIPINIICGSLSTLNK